MQYTHGFSFYYRVFSRLSFIYMKKMYFLIDILGATVPQHTRHAYQILGHVLGIQRNSKHFLFIISCKLKSSMLYFIIITMFIQNKQFANHMSTCYEKYFIFKSIKYLILADDFKLHIIAKVLQCIKTLYLCCTQFRFDQT